MPEQLVLEAGALELMPDGQLAVATRRGDIYLVDQPLTETPEDANFTLFASGLHEVLGLAWRDGWLYCAQRGEVTRMKDEDGDGRADLFETVSDGWEINGDYHEYAFGCKFDTDGNLWVTLCLTGSFTSEVKFRGWCLRITPDGKVIPTRSGIRSPGGIGMQRRGRHVLHRQPRPVERHVQPQASAARQVRRPSRRQQLVRSGRRSHGQAARRNPRAAAG